MQDAGCYLKRLKDDSQCECAAICARLKIFGRQKTESGASWSWGEELRPEYTQDKCRWTEIGLRKQVTVRL